MDSLASVSWPSDHWPLRNAIIHILLNNRLKGICCTPQQLVAPLNIVGGCDRREELLAVTEQLIKAAFRKCSVEFCVLYTSMGIEKGVEDGILSLHLQKKIGSARTGSCVVITDFSFFPNFIDQGLTAKNEGQPPPQYPLDSR